MNTKSLFAVFLAFLILFFGGWLVYGMLLMDFMQSHTIVYDGLMKEMPDMLSLVINNLCYAVVLVVVLNWAGAKSAGKGWFIGAVLYFLMGAAFDSGIHAFFNLHDITLLVIDVAVITCFGALMGATAGWILGRGQNA